VNHAGAPSVDDSPSERSVRRDLQTLKRELAEKRGVKTDAIVVEGGWYDPESEWLPHPGRFPRGLAPVAGFLKDEGIALGLAIGREFGCTYSDQHMNWMARRGYEIIRAGADDAAFCVAGEYYGKLLGQRLAALTDSDGVGVLSLGGFRYSCNEPDHGHAPGIFSRRAAVQSIMRVADIVRSRRADALLELASDAWLSPFWLERFDHVRSGDVDPSPADLPAPEPRNSAISNRDALMYKALRKNDAWFPLRNLTPGYVRGSDSASRRDGYASLQLFADDLMMQIARGSSLHRLNFKADEMSEQHWDALASALRWASDRFAVLQSGEMVGGDPAAGECYGYMHSDGQHSILFARNPWVGNGLLRVPLAHSLGVSSSADKLVLEQVYPERLVVPRLFRSGEMLNIPLNPWETAVYEVYPLERAVRPLVAGVPYTFMREDGGKCAVILHDRSRELTLLNPELVRDVSVDDAPADIRSALHRAARASSPLLSGSGAIESAGKPGALNIRGTLDPSVDSAFVELLLAGDGNSPLPTCLIYDDGRNERRLPVLSATGRYMWLKLDVEGRAFSGVLRLEMRDSAVPWKGRVSAWVKSSGNLPATRIVLTLRGEMKNESMPPVVHPPQKTSTRVKLGDADM